MLIIGIDPGITGSICFFEDGKVLEVLDMPNMADRHFLTGNLTMKIYN